MNRFSIGHTSLRVALTDLRIASIAAVGASDKTAEPPFHDPRAYCTVRRESVVSTW